MAIIATGNGAIPFGGNASEKKLGQKAYKSAFDSFFDDFRNVMKDFYPRYREKVSFFFSDFENESWLLILNKSIKDAKWRDGRIAEFKFIDHKTYNGAPCQAADLFVYANRQKMETTYDSGQWHSMKLLDFMFSRTGSRENHPLSKLRTLSEGQWSDMVNQLRIERKTFEAQNNSPGKPKTNFFHPLRHSQTAMDFLREETTKWYLEKKRFKNVTP